MARITIEDCMEQVPNRFKLVRMASIRAKQLKKGARPLLSSEENKHVVMSLREIAAGLVKPGNVEVAVAAAPLDAESVPAEAPVPSEPSEESQAATEVPASEAPAESDPTPVEG